MEEILIEVLGLSKLSTPEDIINAVKSNVAELRGKMGYVSAGVLEKLKRDGYLKFNNVDLSWTCRISDTELSRILGK